MDKLAVTYAHLTYALGFPAWWPWALLGCWAAYVCLIAMLNRHN